MCANSRITVRSATSDDEAALGRLGEMLVTLHHAYDPDRFIAPGPLTAHGYGSYLVSQLEKAEVILLVAEEGGAVLGYAYSGLEGTDWMALRGPAGVIYDLIVEPGHRQKGIGGLLLQATLKTLNERGAPRVVLATATPNEPAQRLFSAAGFRPTMVEMTKG